jgi:type IV pilus assembly protein PilN
MMSKINLLPWREELRKKLNNIFFVDLAKTIALTTLIVVMFDQYIAFQIRGNTVDIQYINAELAGMVSKVAEIKLLQENRKLLLNRIQAIRNLQQDRFSIVKLLDLMPRVLPDGIYLTELTRTNMAAKAEAKKNNIAPPREAPKGPIHTALEVNGIQYHIVVHGVSLGNTDVAAFLKNLEAVSWLSDVKLSEVSINKNGVGLSFTLEFFQNIVGAG